MELKNAVAVCFISLFSAALVVLIARSLDIQAASKIQPELQEITEELKSLRKCISGGDVQTGDQTQTDLSDGVIVYFVHGKQRCPTCRTIEAWAYEAVVSGFPDALDNGSLQWEIADYGEPAGKHFVTDYRVETSTVVLVRVEAGKVTEGKSLNRVWGLVLSGDKPAFTEYVQEEIRGFLAALPTPVASENTAPAEVPVPDIPVPDAPALDIPIPDVSPDTPTPDTSSLDDLPPPSPLPIPVPSSEEN